MNDKFYIQVDENGVITDHPMNFESATNLVAFRQNKEAYEITEEIILNNGFRLFEFHMEPPTVRIVGEAGYEVQPNGVVHRKFTVVQLTQEERLNEWIRRSRDDQLIRSDWTQLPDTKLTAEEKALWVKFRQDLRAMTTTFKDVTDPSQIIWPQPPITVNSTSPGTSL
jgi:hypothetical protein